jgi:polyribonucleotide nucleotidyltransferase
MPELISTEIAGRTLTLECGRVARQADGAVLVRYGDTVVLAAAVAAKEPREDVQDFVPLTIDYREKLYAAGKIPGGFFKREGRPSEKEILSCRLTDRSLRPLFDKAFNCEIQISSVVLSSDQENDSDILALIASSAALQVSNIPFPGPVSAVRIGKVDGRIVVNPTFAELETSEMDIVVAGTSTDVVMVEGGARQVSEADVVEALRVAMDVIRTINGIQDELAGRIRPVKRAVKPREIPEEIRQAVRGAYLQRIREALAIPDKTQRQEALDAIEHEGLQTLLARFAEKEREIRASFAELEREDLRRRILDQGVRADGRGLDEIRQVTCEVGVLPRTHGSALFTRGQTQALVVTTLGTSMDEQRVEELEGQSWKSYMLHYNFPPFSVGEVRPIRGPGRREIGHGALAERAIEPMIPTEEVFPYTIRIVSDILESNGSSSMATVCGGSLALMDAGVPIASPVAGIAMGLVIEGPKVSVLTDILGIEDHLGDMDFKVTGTRRGVTALQMDMKVKGISFEILSEALEKARAARFKILDVMERALAGPRPELSKYAPRISVLNIDPDRIRDVIGPGGRMIKKIQEETGAQIDIEDTGVVKIAAYDSEGGQRAVEMIRNLTEDPEVGRVYTGKVKRVVTFGAFVEILPGRDGLVHISELERHRVAKVEDVVREGDTIQVKVIGIDDEGKIRLSRKAILPADAS